MNKPKVTNRLILRILAGLTAMFLIGGIFYVANGLGGNPLTAYFAKRAIKQYVDVRYSYLNLEVEKPVYNIKYGAYLAKAKSKTSIDTHFTIYYRNGKVEKDDYETNVLGMYNTLDRLSREYSALAKRIVARELGYENNTTLVLYDKVDYENLYDVLELDMKFSKDLPLNTEVTLRLDLEDNSLEGIAKVLTDAHKAFKDNGCHFDKYDLYAENNGMLVLVNGIIPEDIEGGQLLSLLQNAQKKEGGRISVFIKGDKEQ